MQPLQTKPEPYCPECGARMRLRRPRPHDNWEPFWGCSQYPECGGTRKIGSDGKPAPDEDLDDYRLDEW